MAPEAKPVSCRRDWIGSQVQEGIRGYCTRESRPAAPTLRGGSGRFCTAQREGLAGNRRPASSCRVNAGAPGRGALRGLSCDSSPSGARPARTLLGRKGRGAGGSSGGEGRGGLAGTRDSPACSGARLFRATGAGHCSTLLQPTLGTDLNADSDTLGGAFSPQRGSGRGSPAALFAQERTPWSLGQPERAAGFSRPPGKGGRGGYDVSRPSRTPDSPGEGLPSQGRRGGGRNLGEWGWGQRATPGLGCLYRDKVWGPGPPPREGGRLLSADALTGEPGV